MSNPPSPTPGKSGGWRPPTPQELQAQLPQYKVLDLIGRGGMGAVYQAWQTSLDRYVAIKILPSNLDDEEVDFSERFKQEAKTLARLNHPGIVPVYDAGETSTGLLYFVMEFVEGTDVLKMLRIQGSLPAEHALAITAHVCDALAYAHGHRVIHRDIKPANIMVNQDGVVKVADFGLAKIQSQHSSQMQSVAMGTPGYYPPEGMIPGMKLDHRADIFAVGVMLYQMLTGRVPHGRFESVSVRMRGIDPRYDAIIDRAMKEDRDERYSSVQEIREDLNKILTTPVEQAAPELEPVQPEPEPLVTVARKPVMKGPERKEAAHPKASEGNGSDVLKGAPPTKKKSSVGLVVGILGAVVLGAGAFFVFGGKKEAAVESGDVGTVNASNAQASSAHLTPSTEAWRDVMHDPEASPHLTPTPGGALLSGSFHVPNENPDSAVRVRCVLRENTSLHLQTRTTGSRSYQLLLQERGSWLWLQRKDDGEKFVTLEKKTLSPVPKTGEVVEVELRAVGKSIIGKWQGVEFLHVEDDSLQEAGSIFVGQVGDPLEVRSIEVLNLGTKGASQNAPATAAHLTPSTEPWQDMLHDPAKLEISGGVERTPEGLRFTGAGQATHYGTQSARRDGAVRITATFGGLRPTLNARHNNAGSSYQLYAIDEKHIALSRFDANPKQSTTLRTFPLREPLQPGQDYGLELRVMGQTLTAKLNSEVLGTVTDGAISEGQFSVTAFDNNRTPTLVKALEVLDLDTKGGASAAPDAAHLSPSTEPWQDVLVDSAKLALTGGVERTTNGLRVAATGVVYISGGLGPKRDGALRMRSTFGPLRMALRARGNDGTGSYQASVSADGTLIQLSRWDSVARKTIYLQDYRLRERLLEGQAYELELRVVGQSLTAAFNGEVMGTILDDTYKEGQFGVAFVGQNVLPVQIKSLEVLDLDAVRRKEDATAISRAAPSTGTKDAPFVNSLGMKFVPVPITGGPTGGKRVLFSIWETRVQDYEVFVKETKRSWLKSNKLPSNPTFPAFDMTWSDAVVFAQWLTERERKAGRLDVSLIYRLPSDHEWSCAVGIGTREDPAAEALVKAMKIPNVYPWGAGWPPPSGAGNYHGEEAINAESGREQTILIGYHDDYPFYAPVGSFPANEFNVFDLGGNVKEWCADWFNATRQEHVTRGGAFTDGQQLLLLSSYRGHAPPAEHGSGMGFRVVLASDAGTGSRDASAPSGAANTGSQ